MATYILSQLKYDKQQLEPSDEARKKRKFRELVLSKKRESIATNARLAREEEQRVQARYKEREREQKRQRTLEDEREVASTLILLQRRHASMSSREPSMKEVNLCIALGKECIRVMEYAVAVSEGRVRNEEFRAKLRHVWDTAIHDANTISMMIEHLGIDNIPKKDSGFKELIQDLIRYKATRES